MCQLCQAGQIAVRHDGVLNARQRIGGIVNALISVRRFMPVVGSSHPVACSECAFYQKCQAACLEQMFMGCVGYTALYHKFPCSFSGISDQMR